MGNREDLLEGARKAILERGLAKVTARDIAAAASVSLAAIGYHFGSKDRLISEAITEATGSVIGDAIDATIRVAGEGRTLWESLGPTWDGMLEVVRDKREELLLSMENGLRIMRSPESQRYLAEASRGAYAELAGLLQDIHPNLTPEQARAVGKLYFLMFQGYALLGLLAPESDLLTGEEVATAVEALRTK
ncbi:TetR/AcrR family transcriptional regulator [Nocardia terpenica]|uniref:TetR family transcriptional regulator n=1 Tax=Nocardia terpenica TaxID=455432 RepID=A0A6G9Z6D2_9NOCA|nr:TetR/AcrR family transcriptional regulator [Nocardia terpenica]QIS20563.1 TetR family transcriptional regulator [Nocardia terpenica]